MSLPRAKARAVPRHCMAHDALAQRGPQQGESRSPLKTPCEKIGPLKNAVRLRRAQESSSHDTPAATMDNERDDALIALAVLARCRGSACGSAEVRARMLCRPTAWRDRHGLSPSPLSSSSAVLSCFLKISGIHVAKRDFDIIVFWATFFAPAGRPRAAPLTARSAAYADGTVRSEQPKYCTFGLHQDDKKPL